LAALLLAGGVWLAGGFVGRWLRLEEVRPPDTSPHGARASGAELQ
jgi:hypothetical protein